MIEGMLLASMLTLDIPINKRYPYGYRAETYTQMWLVCENDEPRWRFNEKFHAMEWIAWLKLDNDPTYHVKKDQCSANEGT